MPPKPSFSLFFGLLFVLFFVPLAPHGWGADQKSSAKQELPSEKELRKELDSTRSQLARARESLHEAQKELAAKAEQIRELEAENRTLNLQTDHAVEEIRRLSKIAAKADIAAMRALSSKQKPESAMAGKQEEGRTSGGEQKATPEKAENVADARAEVPEISPIYFEKNSAVNYDDRERVLGRMRDILDTYPNAVFSLSGHADDSPYAQTNLEVSLNRAEYLAAHLRVNGIPKDRLVVRGAGAAEPTADGNRRVEIQVGIPQSAVAGH